jgi:cytochrome P450
MLEFLPTLIARKAYYGRANIKAAFANYYAKSHHLSASRLIQNRKTCSSKWNLSDDDIANTEISTLYLSTTNSAPTSFWLLVNILADPVLLAEIREEISNITTRDASKNGKERAIIDITLFQSRCPLLLASFRETLRLIDAATSVRSISQDILLTSPSSTSSYFLKKGNVIQLPSGITHNSPVIWGEDVDSFKPLRFLPATKEKLDKEQRRKQTQGYFPFGGGKHLCPGRHFATTEILAFVSVMLMGFEIEGSRVPERAFQKLGTAVRKPVGDVKVKLRRRKDWENVKWVFYVGGEVDFKCLAGEEDDS